MILGELNRDKLETIYFDENSQTPSTQRFNELLREKDIDFKVCLSRKDNHLYIFTRLTQRPLFKSEYTCKSSDWVSSLKSLLPIYKVLNTFTSKIKNGVVNDYSAELGFEYNDNYTVELKLVESEKLEVKVTYYKRNHRSGYSFDIAGGELTVYANGWGGDNSFCYTVSDIISVSDFAESTLRTLATKVKENLAKMGYEI